MGIREIFIKLGYTCSCLCGGSCGHTDNIIKNHLLLGNDYSKNNKVFCKKETTDVKNKYNLINTLGHPCIST